MFWILGMLSTNTAGDTTDMEQGAVVAEPESQGKMQALKAQTQGVIDQMKDNLELILEREAKARDLLTKAQDMEKGAQHFKQTSQKVARTYWWKNVKLVVVIVVVVLIVVLIIILLATGVIPTSSPLPPIVKPTIKPSE